MLALVPVSPAVVIPVVVVLLAFAALALGLRLIGEQESGLVIKRFGRPLPPGRLIAIASTKTSPNGSSKEGSENTSLAASSEATSFR